MPTNNGFIEAFNSKVRSECLNLHWFMSRADTQEKLETWRRHYNEDRPYSAIGYNVPIALHYPGSAASPLHFCVLRRNLFEENFFYDFGL